VRIVSAPEAEVPPELRAQVRRLQRQAWPGGPESADAGPADADPVHDPALRPLSLLLVEDGRVLAALDVLSKEIAHRGRRYAASGLSTVVTDEAVRGRGHGSRIVAAARDAIAASGADLGIFTCDPPLQGFYERAGWQALPGTVLVGGTPEAPFPSDLLDKVTLARFFSERARSHADTFAGCRIELYPGEIDRLW
jgi:GNAT superfamily N-acetyltransferase